MAWEEENISEGVDFERVDGGGGSKKKLIMIALAVILVAAGGFAVYKFLLSGGDEAETEAAEGETPESETAAEAAPEPEIGFKVDLDKFTLNLMGKGGDSHFLVATMALEVTTEELKMDLLDPEDKKLYMIKTRDTILEILRQKSYQDVADPASSKEIAKEILYRLNRIYTNGKARNVFFSEFVVQ